MAVLMEDDRETAVVLLGGIVKVLGDEETAVGR